MKRRVGVYRRSSERPRKVYVADVDGPPKDTSTLHVIKGGITTKRLKKKPVNIPGVENLPPPFILVVDNGRR